MAELLKNGSIRMRDGRVLWGRDSVQIIDICEIAELLVPAPKVVGGFQGFGGGGGRGPKGDRGPIGPQGAPGAPGAISQIQDEGTDLPVRSILNFLGSSVQATDNPGAGSTDITINDLFASARIVSNNPDEGTDLTIQDAINNLPDGGDIYVKPGTYVMPAALTSQPAPITIHGSGIDATILDFGGVSGKFISIDFDAPINLKDLTVWAGGLAGQYLYDVSTNYLGTETITLENVMVGRFGDTTKSIEGGFLGSTFAALTNVTILVQDTAVSYFADSGAATPGSTYFICYNVACTGIGAFRQRWGGFKNEVGLFASQCLFGCANFGSLGYTFACDGTSFVGGGGSSALTPTAFSVFNGIYLNDVAVSPGFDVVITGCLSGIIYTLVDRIVDIADGVFSVSIVGCNWASWAIETIRNAGTNVTVSACVGHFQKVTVTETGNADDNKYWDIADVGSTIIGPTSRIDGVLRTDVSGGATTDAFVMVVDHRNRKGIVGIGTVKNTGGVNSMSVRETVTDSFGVTSSATTVVAPGTDFLLNPQINKGTARPSYVVYQVEVASTVAGSPTTYDLRHSTEGAML